MIVLECSYCKRNIDFPELDDAHADVIKTIAARIVCPKCSDLIPAGDNLDVVFKTEQVQPEWAHYENELIAKTLEHDTTALLLYSSDPTDHVEVCRYIAAAYEGPGNAILGSHGDISDRLNILAAHEEDSLEFCKKLVEASVLCITLFGEGRMGESGNPPSTEHLADILELRLATAATSDAVLTCIGTSQTFPGLKARCNEYGTKTLQMIKEGFTIIK